MTKGEQIYNWMYEHIKAGTWINDFHNNYIYLDFCDTFYKGKSNEVTRRAFNYYAGKLVKDGICKKTTGYLSGMDRNNFGCRTINTYQPIPKNDLT